MADMTEEKRKIEALRLFKNFFDPEKHRISLSEALEIATRVCDRLPFEGHGKERGVLYESMLSEASKAAGIRSSFDPDVNQSALNIEKIVRRSDVSATREIAQRHLALVREQRPVRITKAILQVLGGGDGTWGSVLKNAISSSIGNNNGIPEGVAAQIIQQTAFLTQKTIAAAIEDAKSVDGEPPLYPYR